MIAGLVPLAILGAIGFVIWNLTRTALGNTADEPIDATEAAKSAAIAFGLLVSMLAISAGLIDLLQAAGAGERLAGSNADVARGLALLIVGGPVFGMLLRLTQGRRRTRLNAGDDRAGRGWSAYLAVALTIALIATMVSAAQILVDVFEDSREWESDHVAQLIGWAVVWAGHWFLLKPMFGLRGLVHLGVGTVAGLAWFTAGSIAVSGRILSEAYDAIFRENLASSFPAGIWIWVWTALIGAAVWAWHWFHLDRHRGHSTWFATVVAFAIVPGLVTLLFAVGAMISGVGIWLFGTHSDSAVDYFDPAPEVVAVGLVALAVWAYHRWVLDRERSTVRNEAIRFHDYAIAAVGLIGVVTGTSLVFTLLIRAITAVSTIASRSETSNLLIGSIVLLAIAAAVWWHTWSDIDRERTHLPLAESDSSWRKLYLTIAAGVGTLILAVSCVWILFRGLRDLFDGEIGRSTLQELTGPIGWGVAVLGAVWFHVGVWRSDRSILDKARPAPPAPSTAPPPPTDAPPPTVADSIAAPAAPVPAAESTTLSVQWATPADNGELFTLQRAAFVEEGLAYDTPRTPALLDSFDDFTDRMARSQTLVARDGTRIVGSVSVRTHRDDIPDIERLMVAPDRQRQRIASLLLDTIEQALRADAVNEVQLIVGEIMTGPRALYDARGYELIERTQEPGGPALLSVRKQLGSSGHS